MNPRAVFIGFQHYSNGKIAFPLFNVVGGEMDGFTVSDKTLKKMGIKIPEVK